MVRKPTYQNILLCTDYSEDAEVAFEHAFDQAKKYDATLHIMNVIPSVNPCSVLVFDKPLTKRETMQACEEINERNRLEELGGLKKVYRDRCQGIINHEFVVRVGSPDMEIIGYSEDQDVDMIIMGTAGRQDKKRLIFIRTAANVSKFANCQVITIGSPKQKK